MRHATQNFEKRKNPPRTINTCWSPTDSWRYGDIEVDIRATNSNNEECEPSWILKSWVCRRGTQFDDLLFSFVERNSKQLDLSWRNFVFCVNCCFLVRSVEHKSTTIPSWLLVDQQRMMLMVTRCQHDAATRQMSCWDTVLPLDAQEEKTIFCERKGVPS